MKDEIMTKPAQDTQDMLEKLEKETLSGLMDFQCQTVERVLELFTTDQMRVLVADEVGLGKTLIAKGVIAKLARHHHKEGDNLFKVVYICSNADIVQQNIRKLTIGDATIDRIEDTRLSMQHLKVCEQENDQKIKDGYIQIIPLTPQTSFNTTQGRVTGTAPERALMFCILKQIPEFKDREDDLRTFLCNGVDKEKFESEIGRQDYRIYECDEKTGGKYTSNLLKKVQKKLLLLPELKASILASDTKAIGQLRKLFAEISIEMLEPDLVIMDEFQRFSELIAAKEEGKEDGSEMAMLFDKFLKSHTESGTKVLLLSATPYKPRVDAWNA